MAPLVGDFNNDGRDDIALLRQTGGWGSVPVAFAQGNGNWSITNGGVGDFAGWAASGSVAPLVGDFNNDGRDDIALLRQTSGWGSVPIAFAQGNGGWSITNAGVGDFAGWAASGSVAPLVGDFNNDGRDDIALLRQTGGWGSVPVAFAQGNGNWNIANAGVGDFAGWAASDSVTPLVGDFNNDGRDDIALLRQTSGWGSVPIAFAQGNGNWNITNAGVGDFAGWAASGSVAPLVGDFNNDGRDDIALLRQTGGWGSVPVAFAQGNGGWSITNGGVGDFAGWAASGSVMPLAGDRNNDGRDDIALLRQTSGWGSVPIAFAANSPPIVNRDFNVRRFTTASITDAEADSIFGDGSQVLQVNDGPGDVACPVALRRTGAVTAFADGDGSIDSAAEFNTIVGLPGDIMVVNAINWCGGLIPNVIGCAPVPGNSMAIVRFTAAQEGILWAHELGHNRGLNHRNDDATAVMNGTIGSTHRRINDAECTAFRTAPATEMMAAVGVPTPITVAAAGMTAQAEPQSASAGDVQSFVRQVFIHGVPYEEARRFGREAVPVLLAMLQDPSEQAHWANIVVVLGMIGDPSAVEPMITFIQSAGGEQDRARSSAVMSLGYIVNSSGDARALNYLIEGATPSTWAQRSVRGLAPSQANDAARNNQLSKYAILGLAVSGRPEAADALRQLQSGPRVQGLAPGADDLVDSAIIENQRIQSDGITEYYRDPQTR